MDNYIWCEFEGYLSGSVFTIKSVGNFVTVSLGGRGLPRGFPRLFPVLLAGREIEGPASLRCDPSLEAWRAFWAEVDAAGFWDWDRDYPASPGVCDGGSWSVCLGKGRGAESKHAHGHTVNTPEKIGDVYAAIDRLLGENFLMA